MHRSLEKSLRKRWGSYLLKEFRVLWNGCEDVGLSTCMALVGRSPNTLSITGKFPLQAKAKQRKGGPWDLTHVIAPRKSCFSRTYRGGKPVPGWRIKEGQRGSRLAVAVSALHTASPEPMSELTI